MHPGFILYFHSNANEYSQLCKKPTPVRVTNVPIYNGEPLTTIGGSSELLSAVSTQVQLSKARSDVSPALAMCSLASLAV